ncbi:MAG: hypothetical protein LBJ08_05330, partial [Bifidobacteriaceae bacterium]|nr:hypothetical protein [Bifidobacteriaceae bacterium]
MAILGLAWAVAGCQSAPVPGHALDFEEPAPLDPRAWAIAGPADRWVLVATDDAELSELLAETAVPDHPGQEPEPQV